jgi:hypothetical protein
MFTMDSPNVSLRKKPRAIQGQRSVLKSEQFVIAGNKVSLEHRTRLFKEI